MDIFISSVFKCQSLLHNINHNDEKLLEKTQNVTIICNVYFKNQSIAYMT